MQPKLRMIFLNTAFQSFMYIQGCLAGSVGPTLRNHDSLDVDKAHEFVFLTTTEVAVPGIHFQQH